MSNLASAQSWPGRAGTLYQEEAMASKPEIRERILATIGEEGDSVEVGRVVELRGRLGMGDVSKRDFNDALGSLVYKHRTVRISPSSDRPSGVVISIL